MRRTTGILLTAVVALALTPAAAAADGWQYDDVPIGHRHAEAIAWLTQQQVVSGVTEDEYAPGQRLTRHQMAAMLWRSLGEPAPQGPPPFDDVTDNAWNADAVAYLAEEGLTRGVSADRFGGIDDVTRGQMATFLWRLADQPAPAAGHSFDDVAAGSAHAEAIAWLAETGVTAGTGPGEFSPQAAVTRGQMAAFLWRHAGQPAPDMPSGVPIDEREEFDNTPTFPDPPDDEDEERQPNEDYQLPPPDPDPDDGVHPAFPAEPPVSLVNTTVVDSFVDPRQEPQSKLFRLEHSGSLADDCDAWLDEVYYRGFQPYSATCREGRVAVSAHHIEEAWRIGFYKDSRGIRMYLSNPR